MKFLFWNINDNYINKKMPWINQIIDDENPDIFCVAEGPKSIKKCSEFISHIQNKGYNTYYSPTLYNTNIVCNQYGWNSFGLKVFIKTSISNINNFTFSEQQLDGRIIYLRFQVNGIFYSTFLIHGMSKVGDVINQNSFIIELSRYISTKTLQNNQDRIIIMGDFNIEPWEKELMQNARYINSFFYYKSFNFNSNKFLNRIYFNPVLEYIQKNSNLNLIGTFYNMQNIGILDFPLISKEVTNFDFKIITEIGGVSLIFLKKKKCILKHNFDHLPITLKIK